jgi:aminoglycoside phosphotransferase (APT) family kinase protein
MPDSRVLACELGLALYGVAPTASYIPSEEADVYVLDFGGAVPRKVIKIAHADPRVVTREAVLLPALLRRGFEVPPVEFSHADHPASPRAFTVMPFVASRPLPAIYRSDPHAARAVVRRLGSFVGRLQALNPAEVPGAWSPDMTQRGDLGWWEAQFANLRVHGLASVRYERVFRLARSLMEQDPAAFGHRQAYQLLADGAGAFAVIDWGYAGAEWPLSALAGAESSVRFWCGSALADDLLPHFWDGYRGATGRDLTEAETQELAVWQAYRALAAAAFRRSIGQDDHRFPDNAAQRLAQAEQILSRLQQPLW